MAYSLILYINKILDILIQYYTILYNIILYIELHDG